MNQADRETAERHDAIWRRFRRAPKVSHWEGRAPLPPSVTATAGFVVPVEGEVKRRLRALVARLEATGCVVPFPPDYWHITIVPPVLISAGGDSDPSHLPPSFVEEALAKGREAVRGARPFDVEVRGLNAFEDVVVAVPYDGGRGFELGDLIRDADPRLPHRYPAGHEPLPHISLTQYSREDALDPLVELIEAERDTEIGSYRADRLEMFVLSWTDGVPGHVEKHTLPLE